MSWPSVYLALFVSHLAGDFLLQTEWQAIKKRGGLGRDPELRRALALHGVTSAGWALLRARRRSRCRIC